MFFFVSEGIWVAFRVTWNKVKEKMESMGKSKVVEKDEARSIVSIRMHTQRCCVVDRRGHIWI